jgi:hypothetical protein
MKKMSESDKEIQEMLEQKSVTGYASEKDSDLSAYKFVFDTLDKKPSEGLPMNFSKKVMAVIQAKQDRKIALGWLVLVPIFVAIVSVVSYLYLSKVDAAGASVVASIFRFKWAFLFGSACVVLVEYLDRRFVRL